MAVEYEQQQQQQQSLRTKTSEDPHLVPTDINVEVLLRLPVKSLLRCKSVCKLWHSLISDPYFVKSHLILASSNNQYTHRRLIYATFAKINLNTCPLYDVLFDKYVNNVLVYDYPLKDSLTPHVWIVGSCNGLLCIAIEQDTLFIWNPSTRRSNKLPPCDHKSRLYPLYGFGYDKSNDDYKVVAIFFVIVRKSYYEAQVKICSLKTGIWKRIGDSPYDYPIIDCGMFSNGALHWAARHDFLILSLDLSRETYGEILQPVYDDGDKDLKLTVLEDNLCVFCNYRENRADLWMMKVYGVNDSWTKLLSIPYLTLPMTYKFRVPLFISNDGKFLLQLDFKLVVYDSKNSSFSEIRDIADCFGAQTFVESLVSPNALTETW